MSKLQVLKVTNVLLFISFITQVATGVLLFCSVENEFIDKLHNYNGLLFLIFVMIHIWLNWNWIKANFLKRS